jgi:PTS system beta-glucosides-specific IIC component
MAQKQEKFRNIAQKILEEVGGKENVSAVTHCMTRLRFNLKDKSIPKVENVKKIPGVIGVLSAGQFQVIIGADVDKVYKQLCEIGGFSEESKIPVNLDRAKQPWTFKRVGNAILDGLSGSLVPIIPYLMAYALFQVITSLIGPLVFGWADVGDPIYDLLGMVSSVGLFLLPVVVAGTAAKKFGATPVVAMLLVGILIFPGFTSMAGTEWKVYGITTTPADYSGTVIPSILTAWVLSYVEKFFKRILPKALKIVFAPSLSILIMLPVMLIAIAPLGGFLGDFIAGSLVSLDGTFFALIGIILLGALWEFFVITGMHLVVIVAMVTVFSANGMEGFVSPGALAASMAVAGMTLGAALRIRNKEEKSLSIGYFIASIAGGVTEPGLYGTGIKFRRPFIGMMIGGALGALYGGITHITAYSLVPVASVLNLLAYTGGSVANLVNAIITAVISIGAAAVVTYYFGFSKKQLEEFNKTPVK